MKWFKRESPSTRNIRLKFAKSTPVLLEVLRAHADQLERAMSDANTTYSKADLATVLIAASNFHQWLKLSERYSRNNLGLLEYVSPVSTRPTCFGKSCRSLYSQISATDDEPDDPMKAVNYTSLRNLYMYLLVMIETM